MKKKIFWAGGAILVVVVVAALMMNYSSSLKTAYPSYSSITTASPTVTASYAPAKLVCTCGCTGEEGIFNPIPLPLCAVRDNAKGQCPDWNYEFTDIKDDTKCKALDGKECKGYYKTKLRSGKLGGCGLVATATAS